jgi:hypothetical protein
VLHLTLRCYTSVVPTTRPRHSITETDEVAAALRDAAREWPEDRDSPGRLIARLLVAGHRAIGERHDDVVAERRRRIEENAGALTGVYPESYLDELREDWPE